MIISASSTCAHGNDALRSVHCDVSLDIRANARRDGCLAGTLRPRIRSPNTQGSLLESKMDIFKELIALLDETLCLEGRTATFVPATPLLGAIPELDSMAVVKLITALEERFGFQIDDDEIDGATFATIGSLMGFVADKRQG
jgi:acyl carrier protein